MSRAGSSQYLPALPTIALDLPGNQVHDAPRYRQEVAPSCIGPHPQGLYANTSGRGT
jgi:hypothetical protein